MRAKRISVRYLDGLWRDVVRLTFSGRCAMCMTEGRKAPAHDCHHYIVRADRRFRWHPLNGVALCRSHHDWAHANPKLFEWWVRDNLNHMYSLKFNDVGLNPRNRDMIKGVLLSNREMLVARAMGWPKRKEKSP